MKLGKAFNSRAAILGIRDAVTVCVRTTLELRQACNCRTCIILIRNTVDVIIKLILYRIIGLLPISKGKLLLL